MKLLVVGELSGHLAEASQIVLKRGIQLVNALSNEQALDVLRKGAGVDLVMIEDSLNITDFIASLKIERITLPVIACGLGKDGTKAEKAIEAGAKDYLPLPPNAELIATVLEVASQEDRPFIYHDKKMQNLLVMAEKVAPSNASILITGSSGTGKEVMARHIHQKSLRAHKKFIAINCAAIPENLLESELFGHEKGAFTGAIARRIGKFEEADGGTLLLDEISEMDVRLQAKLLRVLQEREIDRLGGRSPVKVDVRILATSNRDLQRLVREGNFREDLFFRLSVVPIEIPDLAERPEDISVLARHFAKKYAEINHKKTDQFSETAMEKILDYPWPGNVRELENTIHRAILLSDEDIITDDALLFTTNPRQVRRGAVGKALADVERDFILETVDQYNDNNHAAKILGISIRLLNEKLTQYDQNIMTPAGNIAHKEEHDMIAK